MEVNYKLSGSDEIKSINIDNMDKISTQEDMLMAEGAIARFHGVSLFDIEVVT